MGGRCYPEECEIEVVRQATDRGYSVFIVAIRLVLCCVSLLSLRFSPTVLFVQDLPHFLPNITKRPAGPAVAGFVVDQQHRTILYGFGFTRNNAPYHNKRICVLRFIVMAGSSVQVQNTCILRYVKNH